MRFLLLVLIFLLNINYLHSFNFKGSVAQAPASRYGWQSVLDQDLRSAWILGDKQLRVPYFKCTFKSNRYVAALAVFPSVLAASSQDKAWSYYARPKQLTLLFSDGSKQQVVLADKAETQFIPIRKKTRFVKVYVGQQYEGQGGPLAMATCRPVFEDVPDFSFGFSLDKASFSNESDFYALMTLKSPLFESNTKRSDTKIVLCLDFKQGTRLQRLAILQPLKDFVNRLGVNDHFVLLDVSGKARVAFKAKSMTEKQKKMLIDKLSRWQAGKACSFDQMIKSLNLVLSSMKDVKALALANVLYLSDSDRKVSSEGFLDNELTVLAGGMQLYTFDFSKAQASWLKKWSEIYGASYYVALNDFYHYFDRSQQQLFYPAYSMSRLRIFKPKGYVFKAVYGAGFFCQDGKDLLFDVANLFQLKQASVLFHFEKLANYQSDQAPFVQGVFRYYDHAQQSLQQRLIFEPLPDQDKRFSAEQLQSAKSLLRKFSK
eukprot:COSAG01_NODE_1288_length_10887_cov_324.284761_2_plen_487_part_00